MQIALPDPTVAATLVLDHDHPLTNEAYFDFCMANPDLSVERTPEGEIVILPPVGAESYFRTIQAGATLHQWSSGEKRGRAFGSSVHFLLPDGSGLSPDAAWVSKERLALLTKRQLRQFLPLVPEFVIEVMSPSDRLATARNKMRLRAGNGVELGWLIDGDNRCVYVYRGTANPAL